MVKLKAIVLRVDEFFTGMSAKAHHRFMYFWLFNMPLAVALYFTVGEALFVKLSLLYLVLASQWACLGTHAAGEDSALAKDATEKIVEKVVDQ